MRAGMSFLAPLNNELFSLMGFSIGEPQANCQQRLTSGGDGSMSGYSPCLAGQALDHVGLLTP
jgi:hypothetical protein